MRRWWMMMLLAAAVGCGGPKVVPNAPVKMTDVPPAVMQAATKRFPGVKFDAAWQTPDGQYELRGKGRQGKLHELTVSPAGQVLEAE